LSRLPPSPTLFRSSSSSEFHQSFALPVHPSPTSPIVAKHDRIPALVRGVERLNSDRPFANGLLWANLCQTRMSSVYPEPRPLIPEAEVDRLSMLDSHLPPSKHGRVLALLCQPCKTAMVSESTGLQVALPRTCSRVGVASKARPRRLGLGA